MYSAHDITRNNTLGSSAKRMEPTDRAKIGEDFKDELMQGQYFNGKEYQPLPDKRKNSLLVQNVQSNDEARETLESQPNSSEVEHRVPRNRDEDSSNKERHEQNGPEHRPTISSENKRTVTTSLGDSSRCSAAGVDVEENASKPNGGDQSKQNQKLTHLGSSTVSQCSDHKYEVFQRASKGSNTDPQVSNSVLSSTITSEISFSALQPVGPSPITEKTIPGNSIPPALSSLIKSSASMFSDSPSEERSKSHLKTNLELSSKFGSSVSLRTLGKRR